MEYPDRGGDALNSSLELLHTAIMDHDRVDALRLLSVALQECRASAQNLRAVSHPTGFFVVRLPWKTTERSVRLHVWSRGERVVGEPCWLVHDHVWSFRSLVLQGELVSREYSVVDTGYSDQSIYEVKYLSGTISRMTRTPRRVAVDSALPVDYGAGEFYELPSRRFHAISAPRDVFAATLVATRKESTGNPFVIGTTDGPPKIEVNRTSIPPDATHRLIEGVLADL